MIGIVLVVLEKVWKLYDTDAFIKYGLTRSHSSSRPRMMLKIFDAEVMITSEGLRQPSGTA